MGVNKEGVNREGVNQLGRRRPLYAWLTSSFRVWSRNGCSRTGSSTCSLLRVLVLPAVRLVELPAFFVVGVRGAALVRFFIVGVALAPAAVLERLLGRLPPSSPGGPPSSAFRRCTTSAWSS